MSRASAAAPLVVGGEPRISLLPPEVTAARKGRANRRLLGFVVVGVVLIVGATCGAVVWQSMQAQAALASAQERTTQLLQEQLKYSDVRSVQEEVNRTVAARQVGASTEVDWKAYLQGISRVLPGNVTINTVTVDAASPLAAYDQPTAPLQAQRVATLTLTITSPNLPIVPEWLEALKTLPGYADGTPSAITQDDSGAYTVNLTMHINEGAYSHRFAVEEGK